MKTVIEKKPNLCKYHTNKSNIFDKFLCAKFNKQCDGLCKDFEWLARPKNKTYTLL